jgi:hypothetical protein
MSGKPIKFKAKELNGCGNCVELVNGFLHHHFRQRAFGQYGNQRFGVRVNPGGFDGVEVVTVLLAPLAITLAERGLTHTSRAVYMPKGCGKIHPFLAPVLTDGAVKTALMLG